MLIRSLLTFLLVFGTLLARAEGGSENASPTTDLTDPGTPLPSQAPSAESPAEDDHSSSFLRAGKTFEAAVEGGFPVFPIPSYGLDAGYFLNPRTLLMAEYTEGRLGWWFIHVRTMTAGLHIKRFVGNSFYLKGGLDYRRVNLENPDLSAIGAGSPDVGRAETLGASFGLGNQWQWKNFLLDVQWLGVTAPLKQLHTDFDNQGYDPSHASDLDFIWNRVAKFWSVQIFRLSIGASF